jgi:hypothetical protein
MKYTGWHENDFTAHGYADQAAESAAPQRVRHRVATLRLDVGPARAGNRRFLAVKRPVHPYKSPIENRFTTGNANGA